MSTLIGNKLIFKESIRPRNIIFIILSMIGVVLVVASDLTITLSWWSVLGYTLMILSIISWTAYNLFTKKVTLKYSSLKVTTIQSIMALLIFMPLLFIAPPDFALFESKHWIHLLFLGIICSGVAYYLYVHSVDKLGLTIPNIFINFIPVVTIITNAIMFKTPIHFVQIIGGIIIITTMTLLTLDNIYQKREKLPSN
jgi:drug/metabolite transporter (DMT)-like permease